MADNYTPRVELKDQSLTLSREGLAFIQLEERFMDHLYDTDGADNCTVGYGHLVHQGKCDGRASEDPYKGDITKEQADALSIADALPAIKAVDEKVKVALTQNQFDALVSFAFNVGTGAFASSTLLKKVNDGKFDETPAEFRKWVNSNGKKVQGLVNRREREIKLFTKP